MSFETLKEAILKTPSTGSLEALSTQGKKYLETLELPHRRIENWKYTNLRSVFAEELHAPQDTSSKNSIATPNGFESIVFVDGELVSMSDGLKNSITVANEVEISEFDFEDYYDDDFASILNKSSANKSHLITVGKNTAIEQPLYIRQHYTQANTYNNYNSFIFIEKSAEVQLVEEFTSEQDLLINHKSRIKLEQNAKLGHTVLQNINTTSNIFLQFSSQVESDGYYSNNVVNIGASLSRTNFYGELVGENAELDAHGLYLLNEGQHHDTMSYIRHISPKSYSHQLYKGVLDGKSRGVFSGIIRIEKDAQEVSSDQLNKNLLLSQKAQANSRPQLEIYADDVKCAHGSTTGQLNDEELFYFESRGITPEKAQSILARAFIFDVILKIKNIPIRKYVEEVLVSSHKVSQ